MERGDRGIQKISKMPHVSWTAIVIQRPGPMTTTFNAAATKTVRVNGTNFVYREIGNKSGIPVLFLHHLSEVAWA